MHWRAGRTHDLQTVRQLEEAINARPGEWLPRYLLAQVDLERDDCQAAIDVLQAIPAPDGGREEVTTALDTARRRLPTSARALRIFQGHQDEVRSVSLSADGHYALSGGEDLTARLWDVSTGECLRVLGDTRTSW